MMIITIYESKKVLNNYNIIINYPNEKRNDVIACLSKKKIIKLLKEELKGDFE